MPHYLFHVRNDGLSSQDDEGGDFDSFTSAQQEAEMSVRELIIEAVKCGEPVMGWKIEITDVDGKVLGLVSAGRILATQP
jgi:hypothetical protein